MSFIIRSTDGMEEHERAFRIHEMPEQGVTSLRENLAISGVYCGVAVLAYMIRPRAKRTICFFGSGKSHYSLPRAVRVYK